MVNRPKDKGTKAETAFVNYLRQWFPHAERRALRGGKDQGDVTGIPGLVFEVKDCARWDLPKWLRETEEERVNAHAEFGLLVIKPPGVGYPNVARWAVCTYQKDPIEVVDTSMNSDIFDSVLVCSGSRINEVRKNFFKTPHSQLTTIQARGSAGQDWYCLMTVQALVHVLSQRGYLDDVVALDD